MRRSRGLCLCVLARITFGQAPVSLEPTCCLAGLGGAASKHDEVGASPRPPRRWVWQRWGRCLPPPARPLRCRWRTVCQGPPAHFLPGHTLPPAPVTRPHYPLLTAAMQVFLFCATCACCILPTLPPPPPLPQGLTKLLADHAPGCMKERKFENYFGRKIAVDASMHIYAFLVRTRADALPGLPGSGCPPVPLPQAWHTCMHVRACLLGDAYNG